MADVYGLVADLLDINIFVTSTSAAGWVRGFEGRARLHPMFAPPTGLMVGGARPVALKLQDWHPDVWKSMQVLSTRDDGRCFYHAVVQGLRHHHQIQLPPIMDHAAIAGAVRSGPSLTWRA